MSVTQNLTVTETSYSVVNNTSQVRIVWTSTQGGLSWNGYTRTAYYYYSINGGSEVSKSVSYTLPKNATTTIVDTTLTVAHNSDGSGTISVRTWMDTDIDIGIVKKSQTLTLTTIPRASTLSVSDGTLGTKTTPTADRKSTSFTHTLTWECGSYSGTLATKSTSTSWDFTPELKLASVAPYGQKVYCTYTLSTYNGSTLVGTDSKSVWFTIPNSVKPSCSLSLSDSKGYASIYGGYIQGESQLSVTINATQAYSSPISRYSASANGVTYSTQTFTTSVLTNVGSNTISATVTDGRGRPGSTSSSITVLEYKRPRITNLKVRRCNADGTENDRGGYGKISFHCTITPLSNKNARACSMQYRQSGTTEWISAPTINLSAYDQDCNPPVIQMSDSHSYEVRIKLLDRFGTTIATTSVSTGYCLYHIPASGKGITFGGIAEGDGFNVKMPAFFGTVTDLGKAPPKVAVLDNSGQVYYRTPADLIYPIGSIYISVNATNPEVLFGGTWEQIQGKFLLGMSSSYPIGSSGGEATHTLTTSEMPSHRHSIPSLSGSAKSSGGHTHDVQGGAGSGGSSAGLESYGGGYSSFRTIYNAAYSAGSHTHNVTTNASNTGYEGGGKAHNNMPPYLAVAIWKRTA